VARWRAAIGEGDTLALVTTLAGAAGVAEGAIVGRVLVRAFDGRSVELSLRAGADTAEWSHERADVRGQVRHRLAPIFKRRPGDEAGTFEAYQYWTRLPLGERLRIESIEITNQTAGATLALWKATVYDSESKASHLLTPLPPLDPARWQLVFEQDGVLILRNERALPRAWLVGEAEAVDGEQALRRLRGEDSTLFEPQRTVLLEAAPSEVAALGLPGGDLPSGSIARVVAYEPARLIVETQAATPSVLVLSEIFYPGWEATVDGQPTRVLLANYLLRSVAVPPGQHRIELRYRAPAARNGAIISVLTLLLLSGLAISARFTRNDTKPNTRGSSTVKRGSIDF